jgi:ferrous iron transport protein B
LLLGVNLSFILHSNFQIALVGNPNCGKSSLFNSLTGLKQKVGNFPGVTVEKKTGPLQLPGNIPTSVTDLPGTYSIYPKRTDEWIVYKILLGADTEVRPDVVVLVADASNLKRNLLFCSQIIDLDIPVVVALSMMDIARKKGLKIDVARLQEELGVAVVPINPRKNKGIDALKKSLASIVTDKLPQKGKGFIANRKLAPEAVGEIKGIFPDAADYKALHLLMNHEGLFTKDAGLNERIEAIQTKTGFNKTKIQAEEILQRYTRINEIMQQAVTGNDPVKKSLFTEKLDNILLHRFWGYLILLGVLFVLFQSIFWLAQYPMDWVETGFAWAGKQLAPLLPDNWLGNLVINGLLPGIGGIIVFVPQIMILFGLINLLEDTGYMARISFLSDRLMRVVGLNGKSAVPMIGGFACAVPAIMSARNIENRKERLLTIMVTPLMSCSARLPVYTILIGLVIPDKFVGGIFALRGLVMMGLYLTGVLFAFVAAWVLNKIIRIKERSFFLLELPVYHSPRWKNIFMAMLHNAKTFVIEAGKVIIVISIILWALSSFGPGDKRQKTAALYEQMIQQQPARKDSLQKEWHSKNLEYSYAGILGRAFEPVIRPLGFDWKIGIALITSFAAREVFIGTMATLYSIDEDERDSNKKLREKMRDAKRENGEPSYTLASGISLMIFYMLAMQCMSTLAVVKRETRSWKWPVIQFVYMTVLAYVMSLLAYQLLK